LRDIHPYLDIVDTTKNHKEIILRTI